MAFPLLLLSRYLLSHKQINALVLHQEGPLQIPQKMTTEPWTEEGRSWKGKVVVEDFYLVLYIVKCLKLSLQIAALI